MNRNSHLYMASLFLVLTIGVLNLLRRESAYASEERRPTLQLDPIVEVPAEEAALTDYTLRVMNHCRVKLSQGRRQVLATQIGRIVSREIVNRQHAQAFVALMCIESRFDDGARSPVGA